MPDVNHHTRDRVPPLFREVNDEIVRLAVGSGNAADGMLAVLCECGDADCVAHVEIPRDEWELARGAAGRYVFSAGHEPNGFKVIASADGYVVGQR